jgi:beta-lactamase superfamily II metal-dependent hydrolase
MALHPEIVFCDKAETILRSSPKRKSKPTNTLLLGSLLEVEEMKGEWYYVNTRRKGEPGWIHKNDVKENPCLKIFYVDVGQGDGVLIESPQGIIVVDGGEHYGFHKFLKHRYRPLFRRGEKIHIKAMIMSHPDADHYKGLSHILTDDRFTIDTIYHNGIVRYLGKPKYYERSRKKLLQINGLATKTIDGKDKDVLINQFSTLDDIRHLIDQGILGSYFKRFWQAAIDAKNAGRLNRAKILTVIDRLLPGFEGDTTGNQLKVEVLAPIPLQKNYNNPIEYLALGEPAHKGSDDKYEFSHSHTRNGHSIVLKLRYGNHSFLLGGDLNIPAEKYLIDYYGNDNPFQVDVAKSCHHGSSDFTPGFLKRINPYATICSSGDNKTFDHPMPDALGAAGKHSRGILPLLFSTEVGRAYQTKKDDGNISVTKIHYGLVNARSNGKILTLAQMKEHRTKRTKDIWDSFTVPWEGKFNF